MYPVSEAFLQAVQENTRRYYWTGIITTTKGAVYKFGADDIVKGSGYISSQCCGSKILNGEETDDTCCHNGNKLKSLDVIASEYGFSSRNAARYLRINYLIQPFKNLMDENKIALLAAVDVSYLTEEEQQMLWNIVERQGLKVKPVYAEKAVPAMQQVVSLILHSRM